MVENALPPNREGFSHEASSVATCHAPAERDPPEKIAALAGIVAQAPLLKEVLDAMPSMVMVLNERRQIVAANQRLLDVSHSAIADVVEKRPGEAIGCTYAQDGPGGCGTGRHCITCGAVNAVLECQRRDCKTMRECRILVDTDEGVSPMDLAVTATPFRIEGNRFLVVAIDDISKAKRLEVLQRTFFHDVINTAGCIRGYSEYLALSGAGDRETCDRIACLTDQLVEAIQSQRDLSSAETGDLTLRPELIHVRGLLEELRLQYRKHAVAEGRTLAFGPVVDGVLLTDRLLLRRVLGNMVKNALEATAVGNTVTLSCEERSEKMTFSVHNREVMPEEIQLQIYQRSFSTRSAAGRGIGTYSIRLFGERYLGGKVAFVSREPEGTTFTLTLPRT